MKMTYGAAVLALTVGMWGGSAGWMAAQETGAVAGSGQAAQDPGTTAKEAAATEAIGDNGARQGDLHVRIVRLSDVRGTLALDRKTGLGFEQTMQNMPIVEGERLRTDEGYAEVEFEDNSTLRLAPGSQVDFPLLALRSSGAKASTMKVVKGTVYVSTEATKGNEFLLEAGDAKMTVAPSTHLRLQINETRTVVSVFNGSVEVEHGAETTTLAKKESLTLGGDQIAVAKKVAGEPYDAWDKESIDYHARYSNANTFAGSGNAFGLSDLNYYGSFVNAGGGCGQMWQPYMVSQSWSPYSNGVWAMYPGAGYSWVSPYPWGWLPYHSGSWSFCQGVGWGWQPGGAWNGLNNIAMNGLQQTGAGSGAGSGALRNTLHSPLRPAAPQVAAGAARPSLVMSNEKPIVFSREDKPGNFVFQRDSAGLGVPRGSLGGLNKISNDVGRHGFANMQVYAAAPNGGMGEGGGKTRGPATLRQGSPDGAPGWRGNEGASRQGSNSSGQGTSGQAASGQAAQPSSRGASQPSGGGGFSQPSAGGGFSHPASSSGSGGSSGGGARSSASSPK